MTVLSGGRAVNTAVGSGGSQIVSSGGIESSTVVSGGGSVEIENGGDGFATVASGGVVQVQSGGAAVGTIVSSGGELEVFSGGAIGGTTNIVSGGTFLAFSGAEIGSATSIGSGGTLELGASYVLGSATPIAGVSGAIAAGVTVDILSGGLASGVTIDSGGTLIVSSGGSVRSATVSSGGTLELLNGAIPAVANTLIAGATLVVGSGYDLQAGAPIGTLSSLDGELAVAATVKVLSGGMVSGLFFFGDATLELTSGAILVGANTADNLEVASGYTLTNATPLTGISGGITFDVTVLSGGVASGTVISGGDEIVSSGGTASGTIISGGSLIVASGGFAIGTVIDGGVLALAGGLLGASTISFGGAGGQLQIEAGVVTPANTILGFAVGDTIALPTFNSAGVVSLNAQDVLSVTEGGSSYVLSFSSLPTTDPIALLPATRVGGGALVEIAQEVTTIALGTPVSNTEVFYGEVLQVPGTTVSASIGGGGAEIVTHSAAFTAVSAGGFLVLDSGGTATNTQESGFEYVEAGAQDLYATLSNGHLNLAAPSPAFGVEYVFGTATSTTIFTEQFVSSGGVANAATVAYAGSQTIFSGGRAISTFVSGGRQYLAGGIASGGTIVSGQISSFAAAGVQLVGSGGTAVGAVVSSGGYQVISGGTASGTTLSGGGSEVVSSGGTAVGTLLGSGGTQSVGSGAATSNTSVGSGGFAAISAGGTTYSAVIENGGVATVASGAETFGTVIQSGGFEVISSGGMASGITVNSGGELLVMSGANVTGMVSATGADVGSTGVIVVSGDTVLVPDARAFYPGEQAGVVVANGTEYVFSDGVPSGTVLENTASQVVVAGGVAVATTVSGGGVQTVFTGGNANQTIIASAGLQIVSSGGIAAATTATAFGDEFVSSGGTANDTVIKSGGFEIVSSGGTANTVTVSSGGILIVTPGADVNNVSSAAGAIVLSTGVVVFSGGLDPEGHLFPQGALLDAAPTILDYTVPADGIVYVLPGGAAVSTTMGAGAEMLIFSGGTQIDTTGPANDYKVASPNGIATVIDPTYTNVSTFNTFRQVATDSAGTIVSGGTITAGQTVTFAAGGMGSVTSITSGGTEIVAQSGSTISTAISDGGFEVVSSGGVTSFTAVSSGGFETVSSGGTAVSTTVSSGGLLFVASSGSASATSVGSGGLLVVSAHGSAVATNVTAGGLVIDLPGAAVTTVLPELALVTEGLVVETGVVLLSGAVHVSGPSPTLTDALVNSGETEIVLPSGVAISSLVRNGGAELIYSGGEASGTRIQAYGSQSVLAGGIASSAVISALGSQTVSGGTALATTVDDGGLQTVAAGGTAIGTMLLVGGSEVVSSGGVTSNTLISGGLLELQSGAIVGGPITFAGGGVLQIDAGEAIPSTVISGFGAGDTIDLAGLAFVSSSGATLGSGNVLRVTEGSQTYTLQLDPNGSFSTFQAASDGMGGTDVAELISTSPPFALLDGPLSLTQGTSATIGSNLLRFGANDTTAAGLTYTIISSPSDGALLLNGAPTTSFTGAQINANDLSYQETAANATADSFTFTVSDPYGNSTVTQTFKIGITSTTPPFALLDGPLSLTQGTTATIGSNLLRFGDAASTAAGLTYTITSAPSNGTLLLNGVATTSFTGTQVNANDLGYEETAPNATADSFTFTVTDPYGNITATQTFKIAITSTAPPFAVTDSPLTLTQGTTATIGSSLLRYGDAASTAAGLTYTVIGGPSDGTLLLNGSPTTSFTGAQVNANELSYEETTASATSDSFTFKVTDPYGNTTATQTFKIAITSTAKPFALYDGPLSLTQGTTATIGSNLLRFGDAASAAAGLTYTITSAPSDGTLLLNGSPTTSFTGAQVNANDVSYEETAVNATSDSFTFTVTDSYGNTTANETFKIGITSTTPPFALYDGPLSVAQGTTGTIGSTLLRFGDAASSAAGLTYTVIGNPSDGTLLLNGSPTTSFTGAQVNAGDLSYEETAANATADSFTFKVTDPYGNTTATQTFKIGITSATPPFALYDGPLSLTQGTSATIGSNLLRFGDAASSAAGLTYTITSAPSDGTLLLNGSPTTSFTGAQVNANDLSYLEAAPGTTSDSFTFTVTDPYGNSTANETFKIGITSTTPPFALYDGPLSLTQGATATIGGSLLRFGDAASSAAQVLYTVIGSPGDGTLLLNGSPTTTFTGAEVNANELSYEETAPGATSDSFTFRVSNPYGNSTATETFNIGITSTAPPFQIANSLLTLTQDTTETIGASLLRFGDYATTAGQVLYTVTSGPNDGTLLLNGSPTTSFTGAEVNAGELSYRETVTGATADSFSFKVSDPYGNTTSTDTFSFQITAPPFALVDSTLILFQGTTAIFGPSLLRFGSNDTSAAGLTYTVTSGPSDGTLLLNGAPTTSFTGAEANADDISYEETAPGATSDAFSFTVSDPYGNSTPAETFQFQIISTVPPFELDDSPLSLAQGATATIGPSLLRFGDYASTAAQVLYTVTSGPSDGTLLLNGAPTTSFTGAEVNANELSYHETANGVTSDSFAFTVSDPYGNATATQHFQINI